MARGEDFCRTVAHCSLVNLILLYVFYLSFLFYMGSFSSIGQTMSFLRGSRDCIVDSIVDMDADEMWLKVPGIINSCSRLRLLNLKGYSNLDEIKYHVSNKKENSKCTVVSLGIGRDVGVELQLKEDEPNCHFFGADPVEQTNRRIYSKFGTFFHTAVGAKNGTFNAAVLDTKSWDYFNKTVPFRNFYSFLGEDVKSNFIDQLMVDIEYAEYDLFPLLLKENRPNDLTFCQMNMEIHMGPTARRRQFFAYFNQLLEEGEFVPLRAATMLGHIRPKYFNFIMNGNSKEIKTEEEDVTPENEMEMENPSMRIDYASHAAMERQKKENLRQYVHLREAIPEMYNERAARSVILQKAVDAIQNQSDQNLKLTEERKLIEEENKRLQEEVRRLERELEVNVRRH